MRIAPTLRTQWSIVHRRLGSRRQCRVWICLAEILKLSFHININGQWGTDMALGEKNKLGCRRHIDNEISLFFNPFRRALISAIYTYRRRIHETDEKRGRAHATDHIESVTQLRPPVRDGRDHCHDVDQLCIFRTNIMSCKFYQIIPVNRCP
jgi:hypothetical protein